MEKLLNLGLAIILPGWWLFLLVHNRKRIRAFLDRQWGRFEAWLEEKMWW